ncbi:hypothetical protein EW146_g9253 [Bondarzewia mesenterica]|uniref:Uncharacterized protein n=1 Tax=Bondarzewia mesenterica TaxID=1095465 RepID=A0A4S4L8C0_9AGAM|nr:hypothetical protein EW146_g9253 [Bondarzewia mesenterica]
MGSDRGGFTVGYQLKVKGRGSPLTNAFPYTALLPAALAMSSTQSVYTLRAAVAEIEKLRAEFDEYREEEERRLQLYKEDDDKRVHDLYLKMQKEIGELKARIEVLEGAVVEDVQGKATRDGNTGGGADEVEGDGGDVGGGTPLKYVSP